MKKTGQQVPCAHCGKLYYCPKWAKEAGRRFCSRACSYAARSIEATVTLTCEVCGQHFSLLAGEARKGRRFCSFQCSSVARQRRKTLVCDHCGQSYETHDCVQNSRFCSPACRYAHKTQEGTEIVKCAECGQQFRAAISTSRRYCSRDCFRKASINYRQTEQYILGQVDKVLGRQYSRLLEHTFEWLINPETGYHLYIDAFYPELALAVEYNGIYHYEDTGFDNRYSLEQRQTLDTLKAKLIAEHGLKLLVLRYDEPYSSRYLRRRLRALDIPI